MIDRNSKKQLIQSAKEFANQKNNGLPVRIRDRLDEIQPGLLVLIQEKMTTRDIQEWVRSYTGMKISLKYIELYCSQELHYPRHQKKSDKAA